MQKWIASILLLTLSFSLLMGCGKKAPEPEEPQLFSAGFAKLDVSPKTSVPLDGYSGANEAKNRWSNFTEKPLYITCTAISDEKGNAVLVLTLDQLNAAISDTLRPMIAEETGIPMERIIFHCTHTHSSVALNQPDAAVMDYIALLAEQSVAAAKQALADRKPVTALETGFSRTEYCNSVRHYLLTNGEYIAYTGAKVPTGESWYGYTSDADNLLQVAKFTRAGGKPILLVNWQAHPCADVDKKAITSDYPGVLRETLEQDLDCHAVYIQGAAGNLMTETMLASEMLQFDRNYLQLGQLLADKAKEAMEQAQPVELTELYLQEKKLEMQDKYGNNRTLSLYGFSIGQFAMVTAPFEIFDTNAMAVKETSPYQMTFFASCTNGAAGYLPTPESFDWTQNYEARITSFAKGTAETVQKAQTELLEGLFETTGQSSEEKSAGYVRPTYEPESDGVIYYRSVYSVADFQPVKNDFYTFEALDEKGNRVKLLIKDMAVAQQIVDTPAAQYLFDQQNVVVGVEPA